MFLTERIKMLRDKQKLLIWCITHTTCLVDQAQYVEQLEEIEADLIVNDAEGSLCLIPSG